MNQTMGVEAFEGERGYGFVRIARLLNAISPPHISDGALRDYGRFD
jgi:hypothetical protein